MARTVKPIDFKGLLLVAGASHSGTSVTAKILADIGFNFGRFYPLTREDSTNPACGYMETVAFWRMHMQIVEAAGGDLDIDPARFPKDNAQILGAVAQFFNCFDGNAIKDPRLSFTVDFWEQTLTKRLKWLFCLRNPASCIESISKYQKISKEKAEVWYKNYYQRILDCHKFADCAILDYDTFQDDIVEQFVEVLQFLEFEVPRETIEEACKSFNFHKNHRFMMRKETAPADCLTVYEQMKELKCQKTCA